MQPFESPPSEICVVTLRTLGDAVRALPALDALKRAWPSARITAVVEPTPYLLVRDHPCVDRFVVFQPRKGPGAWRSVRRAARRLRARRFDLLLALHVDARAGLLAALTRAEVKLGFARARARDLNWLVTTERIRPHPAQHVQDRYLDLVRHLGIDPEPVAWRIPIHEDERAAQSAFFDGLDRPACVVVVGSGRREKDWAPERYSRLLELLELEFGMRPVLVGGPSTPERHMADEILAGTRARVVEMLGDDPRRLVWLLDGAPLVISPDTGALHLARALDTPVVGLYGYSNPKRHGPYRKYEDLVVDGYARHAGEEYAPSTAHRPGGMERVRVEAVVEKVRLALDTYV